MPRYLIGAGSSAPQGDEFIQRAMVLLERTPRVTLCASSSIGLSKAAGGQTNFAFLNAAFALQTNLHPDALWFALSSVEHRLGRIRSQRNGPRTLDLDVLWCYEGPQKTPRLQVPHPDFFSRPFALEPAKDAARKAKWPPPFA